MAGRRKKKRTHVKKAEETQKSPKSFVLKSGKVTKQVGELVRDIRKIMEPNTASRLKERHRNKLKDFVAMAGPLGVSHFIMFTKTEAGTNMRISKNAHGPTITFRVLNFTLIKDLLSVQANPRSPGTEYTTAPLLVLNNLNQLNADKSAPLPQFTLLSTMLQNMFPSLNIHKMHINECRRVVLFNYDQETDEISLRHYYIYVTAVGVSRGIKKLTGTSSKVPNLNGYADISEFVAKNNDLSESEVEDGDDNTVTMPQNYVGKSNGRNQKRAIKLIEIGPRINMKLLKIESGLCEGEVLYHSYLTKTKEEIASMKMDREKKIKEKERRRKEQELNVQKKQDSKLLQSKAKSVSEVSEDEEDEEFEEEDGAKEDWEFEDESESEIEEIQPVQSKKVRFEK